MCTMFFGKIILLNNTLFQYNIIILYKLEILSRNYNLFSMKQQYQVLAKMRLEVFNCETQFQKKIWSLYPPST